MRRNRFLLLPVLLSLSAMPAVSPLSAQTVTAPLPPGLSAQYSYVLSRTMTAADGSACIDRVAYDNGLGQTWQTVDVGASSDGNADLVTLQEYDGHGRPSHAWLPGIGSGGACLDTAALKQSARTVNADGAPYTLTEYELSPLGRPAAVTLPGEGWHQNGKKRIYTYNQHPRISGEFAMEGGTLYYRQAPRYTPLYPKEVRDEAGTLHIEYLDGDGRVAATSDRPPYYDPEHVTCYVRDDAGRLRFVLPPEAYLKIRLAYGSYSTASISPDNEHLRKYGYEYRYDGRGNCIYKRLPGCEPVYYIYDKADRPILSQDGVQRLKGQWSYAIPDIFGRTVLTGTCHNGLSYTSEPLHGTVVTAARDANAPYGYTVSGLTLSYDTVYTATFYDDYGFIGSHGFPTSLAYVTPTSAGCGTLGLTAPKGRMTGCATAKVTDAGVTGYIYSATYYDDRGRVIQTRERTGGDGYENYYTGYDYAGRVVRLYHTHRYGSRTKRSETYTYTYDNAGRMLTMRHKLGSGSQVTLQSNAYDGLGRLASCTRGGSLATAYTYNVRSWPAAITADTLFTEHLYYNESHGGNTPDYRGNISAMEWKTGGGATRAYNFAYDYHSRLKQAEYKENGAASGHYSTYYDYDRMGNITTLVRIGLTDGAAYSIIDNLDCAYEGNRLTKVEDSAAGSGQPTYYGAFHFDDGADSDLEYAYDWNGNVTRDLNKGITEIKYNCLNLPSRITFSDGSTAVYTYSATGEKLGVRHVTASSNVYEAYCDNFIYRAGSLKRVLVDGGYITLSGGTKYHYYLKDHLGNNRMVVRADGTVEQVTHYYPYGGLTGESTGGDTQPYKFNGKELDRTNGLDWYDYGARHMDAALGRFTTMDPLCEKYYGISPYAYCAGNPVNLVDPDGRENIVVVGSNNNNAEGSKLMFINQGIAQIRRNHNEYGSESNTMILFAAGYSENQIKETGKAIAKYGATLKVVNSAQEFIDYVNTGNDRQNDLITNMTIFSHGLPGSIEFGYGFQDYALTYKLDEGNVSKFSNSAFKGTASSIMSFACRSGLGPSYGLFDYDTGNSIAQQMANSTGAKVGAFLVRTDYSDTLGTNFQRWFGDASSKYKTIDNAIFTPQGALSPVHGGSSPWFILRPSQIFTPK